MKLIVFFLLLRAGVISATSSEFEDSRKFFSDLTIDIKSKNSTSIANKLIGLFSFYGCNVTLDKDEAAKFLSSMPIVPTIEVIEKSITKSRLNSVKGLIKVKGINHTQLNNHSEIVFLLTDMRDQLWNAYIPECVVFPNGPHEKLPLEKVNSNLISTKFLENLNSAIKVHNASALRELLDDSFEYDYCGIMSPEAEFERELAKSSNQFRLISSKNVGGAIRMIVLEESLDILIEFYLNNKKGQLDHGFQINCSLSANPTYTNSIIANPEDYLKKIEQSFETRDPLIMSDSFHVNFVLETCNMAFNKSSTLFGIAGIPIDKKIKFELESAEQQGGSILYKVKAKEFDDKLYELWTTSNRFGRKIKSAKAINC